MTTVTIHVTPKTKDNLHKDDLEIGSIYRVVLDDTVTENIADTALDIFHSNVPIKQLDDFDFLVKDEMGNILDENAEYDCYSEKSGSVELLKAQFSEP